MKFTIARGRRYNQRVANGRAGPLKYAPISALAVWGLLVAVNFISPPAFLGALACIPRFLGTLSGAGMDRVPWTGLVLIPLVFASLFGWGAALAPWLGVIRPGFIVTVAGGMAAVTPALYGLGLSGLFYPSLSGTLWLAGLVLAGRAVWRGRLGEAFAPRGERPVWAWALDAVTALLLLVALVDACLPEWFQDALFYHFALPEQYAVEHRVFVNQFVWATANPPGYECLLGSLLPFGGWRTLKAFQWGMTVLAVLASGALARELWGSRLSSAFARTIFAGLPLVGQLAGHGQTDIPVAFAACAAATALLKWRKGEGAGWLALGAAAMGAGLNCKFTAPLYWVAMGLALPGAKMPLRRSVLVWVVGAWVALVPWLCRNYMVFYNPVTPLFSSYIPTFGWDEPAKRAEKAEIGSFGYPETIGRKAASLWLWSGTAREEAENSRLYGKAGFGILLLVAVFASALLGLPSRARWLVPAVWLVPVAWVFVVQAHRYLIPLAGLGAGMVAGQAVAGGREGWIRKGLLALVVAHALSLWPRAPWLNPAPWFGGSVPLDTPVARSAEEDGMLEWVRSLPPRSRVLMAWTPAIFPAGHRVFYSGVFEEAPLLKWTREARDANHLANKTRQHGITHIALNTPAGIGDAGGTWARPWDPPDKASRTRILGEFFRTRTRIAGSRSEALLYELDRRGGAPLPEPFTAPKGRNIGPLLGVAIEAIKAGRTDAARGVLKALNPMAQDSPYIAFRLGEAWVSVGDFGRGASLINRAMAGGYAPGLAWRTLAVCLKEQGRMKEAMKAYARSLELDRGDPDGALRVALLYEHFCGAGVPPLDYR
jgi:hypothetical protein